MHLSMAYATLRKRIKVPVSKCIHICGPLTDQHYLGLLEWDFQLHFFWHTFPQQVLFFPVGDKRGSRREETPLYPRSQDVLQWGWLNFFVALLPFPSSFSATVYGTKNSKYIITRLQKYRHFTTIATTVGSRFLPSHARIDRV